MSDTSSSETPPVNEKDLSLREFALRKYEARLGLLKVVVGTALVGLAGVFVPAAVEFWKSHYDNERKRVELQVSRQNSQQQYVKEFVSTALAQDIELRIRFAEYFSTVSDDSYKTNWQTYLKVLTDKRKDIRAEINDLEKQVLTQLAKEDRTTGEQITHAENVRKLEWLYKELGYVERGRSIVPSASEGRTLARESVPSTRSTPPNLDGFVIFVTRTHTERREGGSLARTIGTYHVTFGGERLPGLEGATVERSGPGSNITAGSGVRIEAGTYPLVTYRGATERYATLGYALNPQLAQRPWPAIGIGETGARTGILMHPAAGFLMSIGAINLSKPLGSAMENIDFQDSAARVVALIDAMKSKLGTGFPDSNNARIPNAWLVISGEP